MLAAGALGITYLMLRNEKALKLDNPALGTRYSGNGDLLGFILGAEQELVGWRGPVITTYLEFPDDSDTGLRTGQFSALPKDLLDRAPDTTARIALITGKDNRCFLPKSQQRTLEYLERHRPNGPQSIKVFDGYGHLDIFFGEHACRDVFDYILAQLNA